MTNPELQELLERLHDRYNRPEFIEDDPIAVPHRYTDRADREIAGFLAATIAWGNRKAIVRNGHRLMRLLDDAPADFVRNASERELARLGGFVHRTFNGGDLCDFVRGLRRMEREHGGVGRFFEARYEATGSLPAVLAEFRSEFFRRGTRSALRETPLLRDEGGGLQAALHVSALDGAPRRAGRRLRRVGGIPPEALRLPLDVHTGETGRLLRTPRAAAERLACRRGDHCGPAGLRRRRSRAVRFRAVRRRHGPQFAGERE